MDPWASNEWVEPTDGTPTKLLDDLDLQPSSDHATFPSSQPSWPVPDLSLPSWDSPSSPKADSPTTATPRLGGTLKDQITPALQTLAIHTRPNSPTSSFRTAGSISSDQWAESNQSPPKDDPPHLATTNNIPSPPVLADSTPADTPDPDDVRWGSFTETDLPPIPSTASISFPSDPRAPFSPASPAQSEWNGETNLGGWDSGVAAVDHSLPLPIPDEEEEGIDPTQLNKGWSSPRLSDNDGFNHEKVLEPAWNDSESSNVHPVSSFAPAHNPSPSLDLGSTLRSGRELPGISTQDPSPDAPASRTSHQNSSPSDAFQTVISKTAQAAANVLKSANNPRRFFGSQNSSKDSASPENPTPPSDQVVWGDFSALDASNPNSATSTQPQSEQKPRAGFFRLWSSKPSPLPKTSESKVEGTAMPPQNSLHQSRDSVSSITTSSTAWPAPSLVSPDQSPSPTASTMSRLFGRFGSRSNTAPVADDQSAFTAPSTELDTNEAKILDFFKTVPIEPQTLPDDDLPLGKTLPRSTLNTKDQNLNLFGDNQVTGSQQPLSSTISSPSSKGVDPFDFVNSGHSRKQRHFSNGSMTLSSGFQPFMSQSSSFSHPKNQSKGAPSGQNESEDDLDAIFSAFQGSSNNSTRVQASNRLSITQNLSSTTKVIPKPLMNHSLTSQGITQVRMNSPQPILRQNSIKSETSSSKIPILPPPPSSSSRAITPLSMPFISPPPPPLTNKKVPPILSPTSFSSSGHSSNPVPLIPPPQINSISPTQRIPNPPSQFSPSSSLLQPFSNHTTTNITTTKNNSNNNLQNPSNQSAQSLSKQDLSFFDSLL